ncbi:hypothetical protein EDEG_01935 [Edhazardia aedis USNM 41457]|uniref:Calcineurin subunit B n=1 Tax=Edhazardia aedis (strain USNM 41457) TaxID=1003232 RepID=J9D8D5_EDHAE|nr:hypothetical protein EDEG_01935 [Edhazardia aedis USNM 41457]|eukprot:EJW03779.1 hypothetical protein EDEG_01935 [Edhazardia aedis USNM 41457]
MLQKKLIEDLETLVKRGKYVTARDLLNIPAIAANPLSKLIIAKYTVIENSGQNCGKKRIDFKNLITDLDFFVSGDDLDSKLSFLFKMYDTDGDGYISNYELFCMLENLCDNSIDGIKIQNIVDQTFRELDCDKICLDDFVGIIKKKTKNLKTFFMAK